MKETSLLCLVVLLQLWSWGVAQAEPPDANQRRGLRGIITSGFPIRADARIVPLPGADFETDGKTPSGWGIGGGTVVAADDAPQGKAYGRISVRHGLLLITLQVRSVPGTPHFLSFWLKSSTDCWAAIEFGSDEKLRIAGGH